MNKIAFVFLAFCVFLLVAFVADLSGSSETERSASVNQIQGYYVYIQSTPEDPFDIVGSVNSGAGSGMVSPNIEKMINVIIKKIRKKEIKSGQVDGFITQDGHHVQLIRFKN